MSQYLTDIYEKNSIQVTDVICWPNPIVPGEPRISVHPAGEGRDIVNTEKIRAKSRSGFLSKFAKIILVLAITLGLILISIGLYNIWAAYLRWIDNPDLLLANGGYVKLQTYYGSLGPYLTQTFLNQSQILVGGATLLVMTVLITVIGRNLFGNLKGIGGAEQGNTPKLIVDNGDHKVPFIDATGHGSAQLFGSIAWDPYQPFSEDTDILTLSGWVPIGNVTSQHQVATLNLETRTIEYQNPTGFFQKHYSGPMYHLRNQTLDLLVHPDHNLLVAVGAKAIKEKNFKFVPAKDTVGRNIRLLKRAKWEGVEPTIYLGYPVEPFLKLYGYWIAEGSAFITGGHHRIQIAQRPGPIKEKIKESIRELGLPFYENHKDVIISHNKKLHQYLTQFGHSKQKFIDFNIKAMSPRLLRIFLNAYLEGDGSHGRIAYTSSERLANDIQEIALKAGWCGTKTRTRSEWYVSINKTRLEPVIKPHVMKSPSKICFSGYVPYDGMIYCITVPNHTVYARRNGKTVWCGNTGGLGTPEHQRTTAGDVHRAHLGILYIDEVKTLTPSEAITLLTVLEDGQLPITLRSSAGTKGSDTAAMAVATHPVPCLTLLLAAGNFDSISQIHPALMDRINGYGRVVRMNNYMDNTVENRRRFIQFIAQEAQRFKLRPFTRAACAEIVAEARRRSGRRHRITCRFRPMISVIKTAATLAMNEGAPHVEARHVKKAINEHCKSIGHQLLEHGVQERGRMLHIKPGEAPRIGETYGLCVISAGDDMTGMVTKITSYMTPVDDKERAGFTVTGIEKKEPEWVDDSYKKVRTALIKLYGHDIAKEYYTHLDFMQTHGVDGPSAGVTMAAALASHLEARPIRQDTAMTGEIQIGTGGEVLITAIGGAHEKIKAAEAWGFKRVLIPLKNLEESVDPGDYALEVLGLNTLEEYLDELLEG